MDGHPIPRQITTFEFKLIGFMTLRQFLYLIASLPLAYAVTQVFPIPVVNWLLGIIIGGAGIATAFLPIKDRTLDVWAKNIWKRLKAPTQYYYHKRNDSLYFLRDLYFLADPHHMLAHVESKEKLSQYLAMTKQRPRANYQKKQVNTLLHTPSDVLQKTTLPTQPNAPVIPASPAPPVVAAPIYPTRPTEPIAPVIVQAAPGPIAQPTIPSATRGPQTPLTPYVVPPSQPQQPIQAVHVTEPALPPAPIAAPAPIPAPMPVPMPVVIPSNVPAAATVAAPVVQQQAQAPVPAPQPQVIPPAPVPVPPVAAPPIPAPVSTPSAPQMPPEPLQQVPQQRTMPTIPQPTVIPPTQPFFAGLVKTAKRIPLPGVLVYVKDDSGNPLRILKTNPHGVFATYQPLPAGDYAFEIKDPNGTYFFATMKHTIANQNPDPIEFQSKELL